MEDGQDWSCPFHTTPMSCIRMHAMRLDSQARVRTLSAVITVLIISYTRQHTTPCNSCHYTTPHHTDTPPKRAHLPSPLQTAIQRSPIFHCFTLLASACSSFCLPLFSGGADISSRSLVMPITSSRSCFNLSSSSLPGSFVRAATTYSNSQEEAINSSGH